MSDFVQGSGPPWTHIVNDNSNYNYNYNPGGNITNLNNNSVHNYVVTPEVTPDALAIIEKALGQHHLPSATFEAQPASAGCMQGTRVEFLKQVMALLISRTGPHIAWIAGMAGTGKTSIALSLCRLLWENADVFLGGTFFCSRSTGTVERTDVQRIIPTLATVFAREYPAYASALARQLVEKPDVAHWSVQSQVERLLTLPLAELGWRDGQIVFVIDALDECSDQGKMAELLNTLADFKSAFPVKFLLTSRPEMYIRKTHISNPSLSSTLQLHTVDRTQVATDIRLYIKTVLTRASGMTPWYAESDVEMLVRHSDGLFIFASTVLKYILDHFHEEGRRERLQKAVSAVSRGTVLTAPLDKIYELVLTEASQPTKVEADELANTKRVLACILNTRSSLSLGALADLLEVSTASLRVALDRLHSLVHVPDSDAEPGVRTLHASLGDYMFDRSPDHIRISTASGHDILARGCIHRMAREDLCFNISRSQSSFSPNPDVPPDCIPLSLLYACFQWAHHLDAASDPTIFDEEVDRTFQEKFLFWLEVLSVTHNMHIASGLLRIAGSVARLPAVVQLLRDGNSFVASSYDAIARSSSHIYLSALPFAPKDSLIYRCFGPRCTGVVSVETFGIDPHSGGLVTTLTGHEAAVNMISYSRDGKYLASGSEDCTVRIWNTRTGEEATRPVYVHEGGILAVAFIREYWRVAVCASNGALHVQDVLAGRELRYWLRDGTAVMVYATFAPDGTLLASLSKHGELCIWATETREQRFLLKVGTGYFNMICPITFFPDGHLLAEYLDNQTIRFWSSLTGQEVGDPLQVKDVKSIAITPDGKFLVAGKLTNDVGDADVDDVEVWDLERSTRTSIVFKTASWVPRSLTFSPDGFQLASVTGRPIFFWDWRTGQEVSMSLRGHSDQILALSYSPNGLQIASSSKDRTVRIWDVGRSREIVDPLPEHSNITCLAVSLDGAFIVSGSIDGSVRLWNARTGEAKLRPLLGHQNMVASVAISSNMQLIASGSRSESSLQAVVRIWDARTGEAVGELLEGRDLNVRVLAFSPDTSWLALVSVRLISDELTAFAHLYVLDLGTQIHRIFGTFESRSNEPCIAFSPDGHLLAASVASGHIYIWRTETGQLFCNRFEAGEPSVRLVAFSQASTHIISGAGSGTVRVWDINSRQLVSVHKSTLASNTPTCLAWSLSWRYIISWSFISWSHEAVNLHDALAPGVTARLSSDRSEPISCTTFSPDGHSVIVGDRRTLRVWHAEKSCSLASGPPCDPLAQILREGLGNDGWVLGPSGELLLWVPPMYRDYVQLSPCTLLICKHRVTITAESSALYYGDKWMLCWR